MLPHWTALWVIRRLAPADWQWQSTKANWLTLWRGEIGVIGGLVSFVAYAVGIAVGSPVICWYASLTAMSIFITVAVLDWIDGRLAALTGKSYCGRCLDPVADKLMVSAFYPTLLVCHALSWWMATIPAFILYDVLMARMPIQLEAAKKAHPFARAKQFLLFIGVGHLVGDVFAVEMAKKNAFWHWLHEWASVVGPYSMFAAVFFGASAAFVYAYHAGYFRRHILTRA
jgi:phosphatidylglycerophosphate synthase